jgi:biopolymer transport protein ExbD
MPSFDPRSSDRQEIKIDVINLIDVLMVLLIFLIVTSNFTSETGLDVNKPKASSAQDLSRQSILVGLSKEGSLTVGDAPVSMSSLGSVLRNLQTSGPDRPVIIVADRDAPSGLVVDVLDECNKFEIKKVSISATLE